MDVKDTIIRAKNGESDAFAALFSEYYDPLFRFVMSRTYNKDKALDICQDVFLKWYEALPRYELTNNTPLSYLFTIAIRLIINEGLKKKSDYLKEETAEYIGDENVNTEFDKDFQISLDQIKELFPHLTENERVILELKYISDLSNKEIGIVLDRNTDSIRQLERRALTKLRKLYKEKYERN